MEKLCLQISARGSGTLDPSLTTHSKTNKYQTPNVGKPLARFRPCARRGECVSYHSSHAAQTNCYVWVGKCMHHHASKSKSSTVIFAGF